MNPAHLTASGGNAAVNRDPDVLYEIEYGQFKELPPIGAYEVMLATMLCLELNNFSRRAKFGVAVNEMLFVLDAKQELERRPDVAFVSFDRWPDRTVSRDRAWNVVPDLAVEVVSRTNLAENIEAKVIEYFQAGVRMVWVLHAEFGRVYAYTSLSDVKVYDKTDELDGGEVLPGFRLPIAQLYEAVTKPE